MTFAAEVARAREVIAGLGLAGRLFLASGDAAHRLHHKLRAEAIERAYRARVAGNDRLAAAYASIHEHWAREPEGD